MANTEELHTEPCLEHRYCHGLVHTHCHDDYYEVDKDSGDANDTDSDNMNGYGQNVGSEQILGVNGLEVVECDETLGTDGYEVIESFESSFADKQVIPKELEIMWLTKAVARYSVELQPLEFDKLTLRFATQLDGYVIDTLAEFIKQLYQERQLSLVNKRVSIVGRDISIDGSNGTKTAEKAYLEYIQTKADTMVDNQKPTAYVQVML